MTGPNILADVRRNASGKLRRAEPEVDIFFNDFRDASTEYVPHGHPVYIKHVKDSLVLEVALVGRCNALVTGDRKHLLPLSPFHGMIIEPPSAFWSAFWRESIRQDEFRWIDRRGWKHVRDHVTVARR